MELLVGLAKPKVDFRSSPARLPRLWRVSAEQFDRARELLSRCLRTAAVLGRREHRSLSLEQPHTWILCIQTARRGHRRLRCHAELHPARGIRRDELAVD